MAMVASVTRSGILVGQAATAIPSSEFLENDLFDIIRGADIAQSDQNADRFRNELLGVVLVDPNRVESEQNLEQLVIQGAVVSFGSVYALPDAARLRPCW